MDYGAEIEELKFAVAALQNRVKTILQFQAIYIPVTVSGESRHSGNIVLPEGLKMVEGEDNKFYPCLNSNEVIIPLTGELDRALSLHSYTTGGVEDKHCRIRLTY